MLVYECASGKYSLISELLVLFSSSESRQWPHLPHPYTLLQCSFPTPMLKPSWVEVVHCQPAAANGCSEALALFKKKPESATLLLVWHGSVSWFAAESASQLWESLLLLVSFLTLILCLTARLSLPASHQLLPSLTWQCYILFFFSLDASSSSGPRVVVKAICPRFSSKCKIKSFIIIQKVLQNLRAKRSKYFC